ncbi:MAG TPA: hypothetical protein VFT10_00710, partial [Solirubrobacterales bacterium]|nr:hypothetical protein [Solirubrobacterales bacterium]
SVAIFAPEPGPGGEVARERGLTTIDETGLADDFDAALVQDAGVSLLLGDRCPAVPQLFVAHSESFDLQAPPQLDGLVGTVVALNDRVADRMRSSATSVEVVRLRQPIDTERFVPQAELPEIPRCALLVSNTPHADRLAMLEGACAKAGLELARVGGRAGQTTDLRSALAGAEIVIGYGRSILEAMACGRAAYVYDWHGGEGWITAASYAEIEADGISGRSGRRIIDAERLAEDLLGYEAAMGPVNHDLVIAHHRANVHAQELVGLFGRLASPPPRPRAALEEMARLVRLEWRARGDVQALARENARLNSLLGESEQRAREAEEKAASERERAQRAYESTLSWRVTRPLRALGDALRRRRNRH